MQRVRMSLPYFATFGWDTEVVVVDERYADMVTDDLLMQSVPTSIKIHKVKAFNKKLTARIGLGSIALRSLWYYRQKVNRLLKANKYDLIYFSTTQFPVCILGAYWKNRFGIPYVIDMQDPWHTDYYRDKPKDQQPPKYWFSYRLNKYLEPMAIKNADGLISVSAAYVDDLKAHYPEIKDLPAATITFGAFEPDMEIAEENMDQFPGLLDPDLVNIVYIGRGGADMHQAITPVFEAMQAGLQNDPQLFQKLRFYFIGTSYAPVGTGILTIMPLAKQYGVEDHIVEITDRISYYHTLITLQKADALFIPGSDSPQYTASKIYPYLLTKKPLLAIFHPDSSAVEILKSCTENAHVLTLDTPAAEMADALTQTLADWANGLFKPITLNSHMDNYTAKKLTGEQAGLFDKAIQHFETGHSSI
jgi:hypothetical protein